MTNNPFLFTCMRCGHLDKIVQRICPGCGRRYFRDHTYTGTYPRELKSQEIYQGKFHEPGILTWNLLEPAICLLDLVLRIFVLFLGS